MNPTVAKYYTEDILQEACQRYGLVAQSAELIRSNSNLIFDCGDIILRLTHSVVRPIHEIELELAWLLDLNKRQLPVTKVLPSKHDKYVERIGTTDHFSVVCFEKVKGRKANNEDWQESFFTRLGTLTAQLHLAGTAFLNDTEYKYPHWDTIPEHNCEAYLLTEDFDFRPLYRQLTLILQNRPPSEMGLIHYDIHFGNFLLAEGPSDIILFDFEMCCHGRFIDDIATVLYYASRHPKAKQISNFEQVFYRAFKAGYIQHKSIDLDDEKYLTHYLLYRDLMVLGFVRKAWGESDWTDKNIAYQNMLFKSINRRQRMVTL